MPRTAFQHFQEDVSRARALLDLAIQLPAQRPGQRLLRDDLLRSAWMYSVGALDAYFCDAYADLMACCLISKSRQNEVRLGKKISSIQVPVATFFGSHQARQNWRWRMAARYLIEKDNVLALAKISHLLNPFLPPGRKLFGDVLDDWIGAPRSTARVFGISRTNYNSLTAAQRVLQRKTARQKLDKRFAMIFQRRHDCIHNCDRPKISVQRVGSPGTIRNVVNDIEFLVQHCERHLNTEFPVFLLSIGCSRAMITQIGY